MWVNNPALQLRKKGFRTSISNDFQIQTLQVNSEEVKPELSRPEPQPISPRFCRELLKLINNILTKMLIQENGKLFLETMFVLLSPPQKAVGSPPCRPSSRPAWLASSQPAHQLAGLPKKPGTNRSALPGVPPRRQSVLAQDETKHNHHRVFHKTDRPSSGQF